MVAAQEGLCLARKPTGKNGKALNKEHVWFLTAQTYWPELWSQAKQRKLQVWSYSPLSMVLLGKCTISWRMQSLLWLRTTSSTLSPQPFSPLNGSNKDNHLILMVFLLCLRILNSLRIAEQGSLEGDGYFQHRLSSTCQGPSGKWYSSVVGEKVLSIVCRRENKSCSCFVKNVSLNRKLNWAQILLTILKYKNQDSATVCIYPSAQQPQHHSLIIKVHFSRLLSTSKEMSVKSQNI